MSGRRLPALFAICLLATGCATIDEQEVARELDLDGWAEAEVLGLRVYTNAGREDARELLEVLGEFLSVAKRIATPQAVLDEPPVLVFALRTRAQYSQLAPSWSDGLTSARGQELAIWVDVEALRNPLSDSFGVLQHELVHALLRRIEGRSHPIWFHEGLAEFLAPTVIRGGVATVGAPPPGRRAALRAHEPLPIARLLDARSAVFGVDARRFYADAWAFVHYGLLGSAFGGPRRTEEILDFADSIARGGEWREAVSAFSAPLPVVEREFHAYRTRLAQGPVVPTVHIPIERPVVDLGFRRVPSRRIAGHLGTASLDFAAPSRTHALLRIAVDGDDASPELLAVAVRSALRANDLASAEALWARIPESERESFDQRLAGADLALGRFRSRRDPAALATARGAYQRLLAEDETSEAAALGLAATHLEGPSELDPTPAIEGLLQIAEGSRSPGLRMDLIRLLLRAGRDAEARTQADWLERAFPETEFPTEARRLLADAER